MLEQVHNHVNECFGKLRQVLADRSLLEAKNALYDEVLAKNQLGVLMTEDCVEQWQNEFKRDFEG